MGSPVLGDRPIQHATVVIKTRDCHSQIRSKHTGSSRVCVRVCVCARAHASCSAYMMLTVVITWREDSAGENPSFPFARHTAALASGPVWCSRCERLQLLAELKPAGLRRRLPPVPPCEQREEESSLAACPRSALYEEAWSWPRTLASGSRPPTTWER